MQWNQRPVVSRPTVAIAGNGRVLSVSADAPIEMVLTLLVSRQLPAVPVVDEYGVPLGIVSLASLMSRTDGVEPMFAGLARRRWYELPAGATAADLMIPAAPKIALDDSLDGLAAAS
jgi:hypothetical protein